MLMYGIPLVVVISLAIILILGRWVRGGSIATASGAATLAFAAFWLEIQSATLAEMNPVSSVSSAPPSYTDVLIALYTFLVAALLLFAAWAIALADAVSSHRWGWVALLCLALYASITAVVGLTTSPLLSCAYSSPQIPVCWTISPVTRALIIAGCFVGPVALLIYALRPLAHGSPTLPDGLTVSPLDTPQAEPL